MTIAETSALSFAQGEGAERERWIVAIARMEHQILDVQNRPGGSPVGDAFLKGCLQAYKKLCKEMGVRV